MFVVDSPAQARSLPKYGQPGYRDQYLTEDDQLVKVVADRCRHAYRKIGRELGTPSREIDDIVHVAPTSTAEERLQRLLLMWIDKSGKKGRRGDLLDACDRADMLGAVELGFASQ